MHISNRDRSKFLSERLKESYKHSDRIFFLPRTMCALLHSSRQDCLIVAVLTIFESLVRLALPIVLIYFLQSLENSSSDTYIWASVIAVLGVILTIAHHTLFFFSMRLGWNWKNACTALVYDGLFSMSSSTLNNPDNSLGTGMMVNLISNDVSRLEEFAVVCLQYLRS